MKMILQKIKKTSTKKENILITFSRAQLRILSVYSFN